VAHTTIWGDVHGMGWKKLSAFSWQPKKKYLYTGIHAMKMPCSKKGIYMLAWCTWHAGNTGTSINIFCSQWATIYPKIIWHGRRPYTWACGHMKDNGFSGHLKLYRIFNYLQCCVTEIRLVRRYLIYNLICIAFQRVATKCNHRLTRPFIRHVQLS
jgi:hypothetical protein